jgi:cytochrome P450
MSLTDYHSSTADLTTVLYWFLFEVIQQPALLDELMVEVQQCGTPGTTGFDAAKLLSQPLLQSTYSEVLRLYTTSAVSRFTGDHDVKIGGYKIPPRSYVLIYTRNLALNYDAWDALGKVMDEPLEHFNAGRFLANHLQPHAGGIRASFRGSRSMEDNLTSEYQKKFSLNGLSEVWIPFGGGDHLCPGQQFAKYVVLVTFATLLTRYDMELTSMEIDHIHPDMNYGLFGIPPPNHEMPFRIRRKMIV